MSDAEIHVQLAFLRSQLDANERWREQQAEVQKIRAQNLMLAERERARRLEGWLSPKEVACRLGITYNSVLVRIGMGKIPAQKHGASWRILESDLPEF